MPDLYHTLLKYDIGHLRIVAGAWGLELESLEAGSAAEELASAMLDPEPVLETLEILNADARQALGALAATGGRMEWALFARSYGEIREMGEGKRDRERPHLKPVSTAETLFYLGLLAKAFFDSEKGAQEYAYIPEDLLELLNLEEFESKKVEPPGRPATPVEKSFEIPATDRILDDATTLLAALRAGREELQTETALMSLLESAGLIKKGIPQADKVKTFLEAPREAALGTLVKAWKESDEFNELRLIPGLTCEGEWKNQPRVTRDFLLELVNSVPGNKWWSLATFTRGIKEKYPDFQRPAGDYDSWFIKRKADGQYLRGFAYWDQVDGGVIRYFMQTMHRLGMVDLACAENGKEATAFRRNMAEAGHHPGSLGEVKLVVTSNGKISIPRSFSRAARYQISRFCEWDEPKTDEYIYRVTAKSLGHARDQGLQAGQLLTLLVKYTHGKVSPALNKALRQWEVHGTEARMKNLTMLRVSKPEILEELRASKAGKFLGELLSPTAVVIKSGAEAKVLAGLAELGILAEDESTD